MNAIRRHTVPLCLLAIALATASGGTVAQERDRDDRGSKRDHYSQVRGEGLGGKRHRDRDDQRSHRKSNRSGCFECGVERRQDRQQARIHSGWRNGDLTRKEVKNLRHQQHRIERMERRFSADGRFTRAERKRLDQSLDHSSNKIRRWKNNDRYPQSGRFAHNYQRDHNKRSGRHQRW